MKTIQLHCANCDKTTAHGIGAVVNHEVVLTCSTQDCGRQIKFPTVKEDGAPMTQADFRALFEAHAEANKGQVLAAVAEQEQAAEQASVDAALAGL